MKSIVRTWMLANMPTHRTPSFFMLLFLNSRLHIYHQLHIILQYVFSNPYKESKYTLLNKQYAWQIGVQNRIIFIKYMYLNLCWKFQNYKLIPSLGNTWILLRLVRSYYWTHYLGNSSYNWPFKVTLTILYFLYYNG